MKTSLKIVFLSLVLLTACVSLPTLDAKAADSKIEAFLQATALDPANSYTKTSASFQGHMTSTAFADFSKQAGLEHFQGFDIGKIEYQQGVGVNAAKVDGVITFSDLTQKNASFIWSYDFQTKDWVLDGLQFN